MDEQEWKNEIVNIANDLIITMKLISDGDFIDYVVSCIATGDPVDEEETL